ncbi:MAG: hypothetical protein V4581_16685 [Bacteroidota bacterium]
MSIVPVNIRPHLVAFFFKEMEGDTAVYLGKTVKAAKVSLSSSLGKAMRMFMMSVPHPVKPMESLYQVYLSVEDDPEHGRHYTGNFYKFESGSRNWLELPEEVAHDLNLLMEDIFRSAFISFMDGYMVHQEAVINQGIDYFINKYDLLETGFSTDSMRQLYSREKKKAA